MTTRVIIWLSFELKTSLVAKILVEINILILKRPRVVFCDSKNLYRKSTKYHLVSGIKFCLVINELRMSELAPVLFQLL
jgi:hypothetical protein